MLGLVQDGLLHNIIVLSGDGPCDRVPPYPGACTEHGICSVSPVNTRGGAPPLGLDVARERCDSCGVSAAAASADLGSAWLSAMISFIYIFYDEFIIVL